MPEGDKPQDQPVPEMLTPQSGEPGVAGVPKKVLKLPHRGTYRPSHKATFIGLAVVVFILAANAGLIYFILRRSESADSKLNQSEVTLSADTLGKLGVSKAAVGNLGTKLTIGPETKFNSSVTVADGLSVGGQFSLNSKLIAPDASITKLQAGNTSVNDLTANGDITANSVNLRKDINVIGAARLQGPVTLSQLLTVTNSANIAGNLAVGGTLTVRSFQANNLISDSSLTIGGHLISRGLAPSVSAGGAAGSNGTVSLSGSDAAGTIAINTGVGGGNGTLAQVTFRSAYGSTPRVVVTAVGAMGGSLYVSRSASGFSVGIVGSLAPGGYAVDYIVVQ